MTLDPPFTDAVGFIDHYEANGWMIGKASMKDWQASVRTWSRKNQGQTAKPKTHTLSANDCTI